MKKPKTALIFTLLTLSAGLFYGCSGSALQNPNDGKSALQSISPSITASDAHEEHRVLQKNTNDWIKNEWEPLTESNNTITKSSNNYNTDTQNLVIDDKNQTLGEDGNSSFTLQHYVDKAGLYLENREIRDTNKTKAPSHAEQIDALPGIGTKTGR